MPIDAALDQPWLSRRILLASASITLVGIAAFPRLAMAALTPTPRQTAGPFYPKSLPLHPDNDLVRIAGHEKQADGIITHIFGRVIVGQHAPGDAQHHWPVALDQGCKGGFVALGGKAIKQNGIALPFDG